jgi:hypothetical protein
MFPQDESFERFVRSAKKKSWRDSKCHQDYENRYDLNDAYCRHYCFMQLRYLLPHIYLFVAKR